MTCDLSKERLIGYHYNEVDPDERNAVKAHIAGCESCRLELESLRETTGVLGAWTDEAPDFDLVFVRDRAPFWKALVPQWVAGGGWRRFAAGMTLGAAAAVLLLAFVNIQVGFTDGALNLSVALRSSQPQQVEQDPLSRPVSLGEFASYQDQSLNLIKQLLESSEERQRRDVGFALARFAEDLDRQRQRDLQLVGRGLQDVEQSTGQRLNQIGRLIALTAQDGYPVRSTGQE